MPYEIRKYDGNVLGTVGDGIADTSKSSLTFIGKNVSNFGKAQNENVLHLLENFASNVEPANKLRGQTWYDTDNFVLKVYTGGDTWVSQAIMDAAGTAPTSGRAGYLWYNTTSKQLHLHDGTAYSLIGPERVTGFDSTRFSSVSIKDSPGNDHAVIKLIVDGEVLGVISTLTFALNVANPITGFPSIKRGINLKNQNNDFPIYGITTGSNISSTATNIQNGTGGAIPYQVGVGLTSFISIGANNSVMFSNGSTPSWKSVTELSAAVATTSTNLAGGAQGSVPYQQYDGKTIFLPLDQEGFVLTAGATRPKWLPLSGLAAGTALTATNASALLNGAETFYVHASTGTTAGTIAERDINSNIWAQGIIATNYYGTDYYGDTFHGTAVEANYADLAEKYLADQAYEVGTVVAIGGEKEVTACSTFDRAIGVVSGNPAYLMNKDLEGGTAIALKGRVPCKVFGAVKKGQRLVAYNDGTATAGNGDVFAIALETSDEMGVRIVEVLVL